MRTTLHALCLAAAATTLATAVGCGAPATPPETHDVRREGATGAIGGAVGALPSCVVQLPSDVVGFRANDRGIVFAVPATDIIDADATDTVVIQRARGRACDLSDTGERIAARALLDLDNRDNLYVFPAPATQTAQSTRGPDTPFGDVVTRVGSDGTLVNVVSAGRGIWDFGVAPDGDALWMTACGPTGIFALAEDGTMSAGLTPPETLWQQMPAVLTAADTFWSVGVRTQVTCPDEASCGYALVRSDADGTADVGATVMRTSAGPVHATLTRCGARVCGVTNDAVVVWDDDGAVATTIPAARIALPGEVIVQVSGNRDGVYVQLASEGGRRLVFVAAAATAP